MIFAKYIIGFDIEKTEDPPKYRPTIREEASSNSRFFANLSNASFFPLNSTSQPATISLSASGESNGTF
jgi:hypothetical protein